MLSARSFISPPWPGIRCLAVLAGLLIFHAVPLLSAQALITADDLIYYTENYPPHNYMENGRFKGVSVEIIELIWQKLGAAKTREAITLLPWARAIRQLEAIPNTVLFGMGYSPERATKFFWVGPYYTHVLSLIAPKRLGLKLRSLAHAKPFRIGVVREDIGHKTLVSKGFSPDRLDLSRDIDELHRKFIRNRFDLICYTRNSYFTYLATRAEDAEWLEEVFTVSEAKSGFGFNRGIPADLIHRFQEALDQLIKEGAVARILKAYDLK